MMRGRNVLNRLMKRTVSFLLVWSLLFGFAPSGMMIDAGEDGISLAPNLEMIENDDGSVTVQARSEDESDATSGVESDTTEEGEPAEDAEPSEGEIPENGEPSENEVPESEPADSETGEEEIDDPSDWEPEPEEDGPELIRRGLGGAKLRGLLGSGAVEWIDLPVAYLDEYGTSLLHGDCIKVTSSSTTWGAAGYAAWYAVTEDVTVASRITVNGDVCLILADGATLTASAGITVNAGNSLTIYGQSAQTGKLNATVTSTAGAAMHAAIGGEKNTDGGNITINGGQIIGDNRAAPINGGAGIGGGGMAGGNYTLSEVGTVTINNGQVYAYGAYNAAGIGGGSVYQKIGGTITVNGGEVHAFGGVHGTGIGGGSQSSVNEITINGGTIEAVSGGGDGAGIGKGTAGANKSFGIITINGGEITARGAGTGPGIGSNAGTGGGTIIITGGTVTASSGNGSGTAIGSTASASCRITVSGGIVNATDTAGIQCADLTLTWTDETFDSTEITANSYGCTMVQEKPYVLKTTGATANTTNAAGVTIVPGAETLIDPVPYLDEHGDRQNCISYCKLSEALTNTSALASGWYVVDKNITHSSRITCSGDVHLILTDGTTLTATSGGVAVPGGSSLTIYSQKFGSGMGALTATGGTNQAGIGGNSGGSTGNIAINGGAVTARAGSSPSLGGTGIGAGGNECNAATITINNGVIYAYGALRGAGIGGTCNKPAGTIVINGGEVHATSGANASGIGSGVNTGSGAGKGIITINGGVIEAKSTDSGAGIGGGWASAVEEININGGTITTNGSTYGAGIGSGGGWFSSAAPSGGRINITGGIIKATGNQGAGIGGGCGTNTSYGGAGGTIKITGGSIEATSTKGSGIGGGGTNTSGTLTLGWTSDSYSSTAIKANSYQVSSVTFSQPYVLQSAPETLASYTNSTTNNMAGATIVPGGPVVVHYLDYNTSTRSMERQGVADYTILTAAYLTEKSNTLTSGWYVVESDVTASARITCSGNVHLILCDGATLNAASGGIAVNSGNSLNIYAQSEDAAMMGALTATGGLGQAGIGGDNNTGSGTIVINGGAVVATSGGGGAGIGGGDAGAGGSITINGGTVHAIAKNYNNNYGAGIGGGDEYTGADTYITINGGIVKAEGIRGSAGIGGGAWGQGGTIIITGGSITAVGAGNGAAIGGGGGGNPGAAGNITITGGNITATSASGAGIGGAGTNIGGTLTLDWSGTGASGGLPRITASKYQLTTVAYAAAGRTFANITTPGTALTVDQIKALTNATIIPKQTGNGVYYLDENGEGQICTTYNTVTNSTTSLTAGWWVVSANTTVSSRVTCSGAVHLILCDGTTLTATAGGINVDNGNSLAIYAQSTGSGMGKLDAKGGTNQTGIGSFGSTVAGAITINGGQITASSGGNLTNNTGGGSGIGSVAGAITSITINGGDITAVAINPGAGIGSGTVGTSGDSPNGVITINGGTVHATGGMHGAGIGGGTQSYVGKIKITGGTVVATAGLVNASGTGTTGWSAAGIGSGAYTTASNNAKTFGDIEITGGVVRATAFLADSSKAAGIGGAGNVVTGGSITITGGDVEAVGGGTAGIGSGGTTNVGTVTLDWSATSGQPRITSNGYQAATVTYANAKHTFANAADPTVALTTDQIKALSSGTILPTQHSGDDRGIYYLDANGDVQLCASYTRLTGEETRLNAGWYAVTENITLPARITCYGDVHLILCNGKTLTATNGGIGVNSGNGLTIYAQSTDAATMGVLTARAVTNNAGNASGIGGNYGVNTGTITINGGKITSTGINISGKPNSGDHGGAGIGGCAHQSGGKIVINGGIITATGGRYAAGIGGGEWAMGGNITINGGTVTARGDGESAGIGGGWNSTESTANNITINGGTVTATGNGRGAGIGGGGRSNSTDGGRTGGTITITGGTVRAFSSTGAGIGGSNNSNYTSTTGTGGTITITGGDITASTGNSYAAAIGGAGNASGGTITITGGTVNVTKNASGASVAGIIGGHGTGGGTLILGWQNNDVAEGYPRITSSGYKIGTLTYQTDAGETECFAQEDDTSHSLLAKVDLNGFDTSTTIVPRQPNQRAVPYLDYVNGAMETRYCGEYTTLTATYLDGGSAALTDGWYVVDSTFTYATRIVCNGEVHLILKNGATLTASAGVSVLHPSALTIYQQPLGNGETMGGLVARTTSDVRAPIGGDNSGTAGAITINGGTINASNQGTGTSNRAAAIGGSYQITAITINGGNVTATGHRDSAAIGTGMQSSPDGVITINGGTVVAHGYNNGVGIGGGMATSVGHININGGNITADTSLQASYGCPAIGSGASTFGEIRITGGTVRATGSGGSTLRGAGIGGSNNTSSGTLIITGGTVDAISSTYIGIGATNANITITGGTVNATGNASYMDIGGTTARVSLGSNNPASGYPRITAQKYVGELTLGTSFLAEGGVTSLTVSDIQGFAERKTIYPAVSVANTVPYLDYVDGDMVTRYVIGPTELTAAYLSANSNTLTAGWYTVTGEVTAGWYTATGEMTGTSRIICSGAVHLILKDGCTLTADEGINVTAGNALSLYAQSLGENSGQLIANGVDWNAGIGGNGGSFVGSGQTCGIVTINGGQIQATGGVGGSNKNAPGIGSGNNASGRGTVIINNGTVVARTGGSSTAAIGGGGNTPGCNVTIRGGTVDAQVGSVNGAAIGGGGGGGTNVDLSGGTVLISGGTVIATSAGNGAAIGGGYGSASGVNMSAGTITITGGTVTANGKIGGGGSTATGTLTLGWADPDGTSALPEITASSYQVGTVTYAVAGQAFGLKSSRETALTEAQVKALTNQTIIPAGVMYLDYVDGKMVEKWACATPLTAAYLSANSNTLAAGWYAVTGNVTAGARITCSGAVHLILKDGATLTGTSGGIAVNTGNSLTIYAQSEDADTMGVLTATGAANQAGIGGNDRNASGTITINGGAITAVGGSNGNSGEGGAGIGGGSYGSGSVTIHGGIVDATGGNAGAGIGAGCMAAGNVTITGGVIHARSNTSTASDKNNGAAIGGGGGRTAGGSIAASNISISGGMVYAQAYGKGAGIGGAGSITGTYSPAGTIRITGGIIEAKSAKGSGIGGGALNTGIVPSGTLTLDWAGDAATSGEPRITASSYSLATVTYANAAHTFVLDGSAVDVAALTTEEIKALTNRTIIPGVGGVKYLDYVDGELVEKVRGTYTTLTADYLTEHSSTLSAGWYAVDSTFTYATRIVCDGDVHLILADGYTLTANKGVSVNSGNSLTIYAQSTGAGTMGKLTAPASDSWAAGIGGDLFKNSGAITINGGVITARATDSNTPSGGPETGSGSGIGGGYGGSAGNVTINAGMVTATGGSRGAGIGGGETAPGGTITINGGTVTATGGTDAAGIGGGSYGTGAGGTITITGGKVTATGGGSCGAGIGGGWGATGGTIVISGGDLIKATGNAGAGIGGGGNGMANVTNGAGADGGNIKISGGVIEAKSTAGAAIGGGGKYGDASSSSGSAGTIHITGGKISAVSTSHIGIGGKGTAGSVHLGWTNDTFFTTEITANSYGGTVTFDRPYVKKNVEPETLAYWTSASENNINGATIIPGINLMGEVTLTEGRQYAAFTNGTESLTMPLNSAWTAQVNVNDIMEALNELNGGAATLSEIKAVFGQSLPVSTVLTLTVVTGSGGSASYEHYYATLSAATDTVQFTSFASMRNRGLRFHPSRTDTRYLLSVDFAPTGMGTATDVGVTFTATYTDGGGVSRTATVSDRCKYTLVALGTLTADATTVKVTAQPMDSALLSEKKVYLVGELPGDLKMPYGVATYDGMAGKWISDNVVVFELGTYGHLSGVSMGKMYTFDWLGQSAGSYPITWQLRTGTSVWNIRGNQSVNELAKVSGGASATVAPTASDVARPYLTTTARTAGDRLYATGGQNLAFDVATNRTYAWYVEKQTGLAAFGQVSGAAYSQTNIAATTTSVTIPIPAAAGTYRVRFSMVNDDQTVNDNVYYTVVVE